MIQPNTLYNKLIQTDEMTKIQIQSYMYMCIDKNIEKNMQRSDGQVIQVVCKP